MRHFATAPLPGSTLNLLAAGQPVQQGAQADSSLSVRPFSPAKSASVIRNRFLRSSKGGLWRVIFKHLQGEEDEP